MKLFRSLIKSLLASVAMLSATELALAQTRPAHEATNKPLHHRGIEVKVSGEVYVDIAENFGVVPAFLNFQSQSYLVFTPLGYNGLADLRRKAIGRNPTVQFGDTPWFATVCEVENFVLQVYGVDEALSQVLHNSLILASAGNKLNQRRDLEQYGVPSGLSTIRRIQFLQRELNDPLAKLDNRLNDGVMIFETVRIRRPNMICDEGSDPQ